MLNKDILIKHFDRKTSKNRNTLLYTCYLDVYLTSEISDHLNVLLNYLNIKMYFVFNQPWLTVQKCFGKGRDNSCIIQTSINKTGTQR